MGFLGILRGLDPRKWLGGGDSVTVTYEQPSFLVGDEGHESLEDALVVKSWAQELISFARLGHQDARQPRRDYHPGAQVEIRLGEPASDRVIFVRRLVQKKAGHRSPLRCHRG